MALPRRAVAGSHLGENSRARPHECSVPAVAVPAPGLGTASLLRGSAAAPKPGPALRQPCPAPGNSSSPPPHRSPKPTLPFTSPQSQRAPPRPAAPGTQLEGHQSAQHRGAAAASAEGAAQPAPQPAPQQLSARAAPLPAGGSPLTPRLRAQRPAPPLSPAPLSRAPLPRPPCISTSWLPAPRKPRAPQPPPVLLVLPPPPRLFLKPLPPPRLRPRLLSAGRPAPPRPRPRQPLAARAARRPRGLHAAEPSASVARPAVI